jgi:hypothetical protein
LNNIISRNTLSWQELALHKVAFASSPSQHTVVTTHQPKQSFNMRFSLAAVFIGSAAAAMIGGQGGPSGSGSGGPPPPTGSVSHLGDSHPTGGAQGGQGGNGGNQGGQGGQSGKGGPPLMTSTIYTTRESTVYACPSTVTDCPVESKTAAAVVTDTIVIGTTICPLTESQTAAPIPTSSCMGKSETCTVTVTHKGPPPYSVPHNATTAGAHATGTG